VPFHDANRHRKPEPDAACRILGGEEWIKDAPPMLGCNPDPRIFNRENESIGVMRSRCDAGGRHKSCHGKWLHVAPAFGEIGTSTTLSRQNPPEMILIRGKGKCHFPTFWKEMRDSAGFFYAFRL